MKKLLIPIIFILIAQVTFGQIVGTPLPWKVHGYGGSGKVDSSVYSTKANVNHVADSVLSLVPAQFNPIAGTNITLSGTYPNITFNSTGGSGTVTYVKPGYGINVDSSSGNKYTASADTASTHGLVSKDRLANLSDSVGLYFPLRKDSTGKNQYIDTLNLHELRYSFINRNIHTDSTLTDKKYVDSSIAASGGGSGGIDSVRQKLGSDTINQYKSGTASFAFRTQRVFNVLNYGAKGDNSTDNTTVFATIVSAIVANGGGVMYFPFGVYIGQIVLPTLGATQYLSIEILGEAPPVQTVGSAYIPGYSLPNFGSILKSNATTGDAVISVAGTNFSQIAVEIKNMDIRTYDNPQINGVDLQWALQMKIDNVYINTNTYCSNASFPSYGTTGLLTPNEANASALEINNFSVSGYYNGMTVNEHITGDALHIYSNVNGMKVLLGYHASNFTRVDMSRNTNNIYIAGNQRINITQLDLEQLMDSTTSTGPTSGWQFPKYDIVDTATIGIGNITYSKQQHGFGTYTSLVNTPNCPIITNEIGKSTSVWGKVIGTLSNQTDLQTALNTKFVFPSVTAGSVFFSDGSSNIIQNNSRFFWNNSAFRLGIGINSPQAPLHIVYNDNSSANLNGFLLEDSAGYQANLAVQGTAASNPYQTILSSTGAGQGYLQVYSPGLNAYNIFNTLSSAVNFQVTASTYANRINALSIATNGNITALNLKTGSTPPTTSGTTRTVITDANGLLSSSGHARAQATLVAGTKSITVTGVTGSSNATVSFVSVGGTITTTWQYAIVCTTNTVTITALTNTGSTDTSDTSILTYDVTF